MLTVSHPADLATNASASRDRLLDAYQRVRRDLLTEQNEQGYWVGQLSSSPLSTATAISALVIAEQQADTLESVDLSPHGDNDTLSTAYQGDLSELLIESLTWLAEQQNDDGGWGDTDRSKSNLATTLLVLSAFRLTCVPARYADLEPRAEEYIRQQEGVAGLKKRYGKDKTFAVPILANCALAGVVPWRQVSALPFELAALPQQWFKWLRLPVVSYALPALVAIGLVKFVKHPPTNPLTRWLRRKATGRCLKLVEKMQPASGGFLEATPLTSFVVMALAGAGYAKHPIVRRGVEFLLASVRQEGAWPIDTDLACWNTTLALNALSEGENRASRGTERLESGDGDKVAPPAPLPLAASIDWLLGCQHTQQHSFTDAAPGGWAWTNLSGGVPDADDTPGALLVLAREWQAGGSRRREDLARAARLGVDWLLNLQNNDGGWPTFCRGWGTLPFDRSAADLTAHALRALHTWNSLDGWDPSDETSLKERINEATKRGLRFLANQQQSGGAWNPLWFGNENRSGETNPVYGTARVLRALGELSRHELSRQNIAGVDATNIHRGVNWLLEQQHADGGWGSDPRGQTPVATVEETAVALEALLHLPSQTPAIEKRIDAAIDWLVAAIERGEHRSASPIGLYFAKLWYYERLYPIVFATAALGAALARRDGTGVETIESRC